MERIKGFQINIPDEWRLIQEQNRNRFQLPATYDSEEVVMFATSVIPVVSPFKFAGSFKLIYSDLTWTIDIWTTRSVKDGISNPSLHCRISPSDVDFVTIPAFPIQEVSTPPIDQAFTF